MFSEWESAHIDANANKNTEQTLTAFQDTNSRDYNLHYSLFSFSNLIIFSFFFFFRFCMLE